MVFLHFPSSLTEEEQMLQSKYAKLGKKKKRLAQRTASGKTETQTDKLIMPSSSSQLKKSSPLNNKDAKDAAKEAAKKLLRAGSININPTTERDRGEKSAGFKRSQGLERKLTGLDNARAGYQPFSATHGPGGGFDTGGEDMNPEPVEPPPTKKVKNLYDSFVAARDREERGLDHHHPSAVGSRNSSEKAGSRHGGNTIYVFGYQITEELLKSAFGQMGKIVNISMEVEKNCGFVTYDKAESAEKAINDRNGSVVDGIQLKVSMARRQPVIDPINDASSSATWSTIAASHSQKGSHKDKRDLVAYDEDVF